LCGAKKSLSEKISESIRLSFGRCRRRVDSAPLAIGHNPFELDGSKIKPL